MLKKAAYQSCESEDCWVVYLIVGDCCYFSGIQRTMASTINAAEEVILAITEQEHVPIRSLRYFDLQTHEGYGSKLPGAYEINELKVLLDDRLEPHVVSWMIADLPPEIFEAFREHIGFDLKIIYSEVEGESEGLIIVCDKNGLWFYVHPDGTPAFPERYVDLSPFRDGLAWVCRGNDEWAQIDHEGKVKSEWISGKRLWQI